MAGTASGMIFWIDRGTTGEGGGKLVPGITGMNFGKDFGNGNSLFPRGLGGGVVAVGVYVE